MFKNKTARNVILFFKALMFFITLIVFVGGAVFATYKGLKAVETYAEKRAFDRYNQQRYGRRTANCELTPKLSGAGWCANSTQ